MEPLTFSTITGEEIRHASKYGPSKQAGCDGEHALSHLPR